MPPNRHPSLIGQRFGRLTVLEMHSVAMSNRGYPWVVRCECGNTRIVKASDLRRGHVTGCGRCGTKHGHAADARPTPTYGSWVAIFQRCLNPRCRSYPSYGGRGITVCDRWRHSFESFLEDMGERPDGMTLDRIDPNGNYEPSNCRWASRTDQSRNQRDAKLTADLVQEIHGRCEHGETQSSVAARMGVSRGTVSQIRTGRIWRDQLEGAIT